ncbi:unnamed protein product [Adineta ricciae]|uniref:MULE transposase domain-containing protein n=1 Tax=Adineta ricciae TaxID=249248 RepID=A0A815S6H0_ADIRI|nr:unnamed protein product [Adineta ricciae]
MWHSNYPIIMNTDSVVLTFVYSTKSKRTVCFDGYIYTLNKDRGAVKYWRCEDRSCSAFLHTDGNNKYKAHTGTHVGHLPSPEEVELMALSRTVKERVVKQTMPIARIYEQELDAAQLSRTEPYAQTLGGKKFLLHDILIGGQRTLTFANDLQLTILFKSNHIFIESTFQVCPPLFVQVSTIHGVHQKHVVPCVIALLPGRSATIYKRLFQLLDQEAADLHMTFEPKLITSDFESGLIKAVKHHFPMSRHVGCFFHFTQSVHRKIQQLGLSVEYKNNEETRSLCQQLMALGLLPRDKVLPAFEHLTEAQPESLEDLFDYFEDFWMETTLIELWNVSDLKIRTNNNAEDK